MWSGLWLDFPPFLAPSIQGELLLKTIPLGVISISYGNKGS